MDKKSHRYSKIHGPRIVNAKRVAKPLESKAAQNDPLTSPSTPISARSAPQYAFTRKPPYKKVEGYARKMMTARMSPPFKIVPIINISPIMSRPFVDENETLLKLLVDLSICDL